MNAKKWRKVVGQRFRRLREKAQTSQEALAIAMADFGVDVEQYQISRIEKGERDLSAPEIQALARVWRIAPDKLLAALTINPRQDSPADLSAIADLFGLSLKECRAVLSGDFNNA